MSGLTNALQELRHERKQAQSQVEKLDRAIAVMESLNGSGMSSAATSNGTSHKAAPPVRVISAASRLKMAQAQKARWAKARNGTQPGKVEKKIAVSSPTKRTMSASARRKIAAAQRARWAKLKAVKKAA
jgi:hypothetical protein